MSMKDGGPAFPSYVQDGMSIRQFYKAAVLPTLGVLAEAMIIEDEEHSK